MIEHDPLQTPLNDEEKARLALERAESARYEQENFAMTANVEFGGPGSYNAAADNNRKVNLKQKDK